MITSLELKNIQSHKDSKLDLSSGVNVIVGQSDHGKSSILRGLIWLITNRPSGDSLISNWIKDDKDKLTEESSIVVSKNENLIKRTKSRKENTYSINEKELATVGTDVPMEIQNILNLSEVNIQKQFDAPFLLGSSGAEVARFFNSVINLEQIDSSLSLIDKKKKQNSRDKKQRKLNTEELEKELLEFNFLDNLKKIINELELIEDGKLKISNKVEIIKELGKKYREQKEAIISVEEIIKAENIIDDLEKIKEHMNVIVLRKEKLKSDYVDYIENKEIFEKTEKYDIVEKYVIEASNISLDNSKAENLKKLIIEYNEAKQFQDNKINEININEIIDIEKQVKDNKNKLTSLKLFKHDFNDAKLDIQMYEEKLVKLKNEMPDVCPTCGQDLNGVKL